jgi:C4-dicarboxylate transporter DctQ subunit
MSPRKSFLRGLFQFQKVSSKFLGWITTIAFIFMLLFMLVQVFTRFVIKVSVPWTEELVRYFFMAVGFLGSSVAINEHSHIVIDMISGVLSKQRPEAENVLNKLFKALCCILICAFCTVMSVMCFQFAMRIKTMGQLTPALHMPKWWLDSMVTVGFIFMAVFSLIEFFRAVFSDANNSEAAV